MKMNELSDIVQYVIPENTEIVFNILSHTRNVFLMLLEGEANIHVQKREISLPLWQEFPIPVWECLCPILKTKTGCNIYVRGNHYVSSSAQKGFLENKLFIVSPSGDNYSFILEKDIQIEIFPLKCVDPESRITLRSTRGTPQMSGFKLSSNTTYSLPAYSTVLLKSSDGEPYSICVQGLDRKVKLSLVDEKHEMCMNAVKEHIFNQCLLGKRLKHFSPTVLVLGTKNVGKSSFCRLLVNEALAKKMSPVYIDLNVQRSLSVPGSLSLTEIEGRTDSTLSFKFKTQKLLHFGSVTFHSINMPLYHHLVRKMNAMLLFHQRYGKKNYITIIDTVGSQGHNIEVLDCILGSFTVDLVVVMGDQQYYENFKQSSLKSVPSEFIPTPQNMEPQNDDYKSRYYQHRIQEYFGSTVGRPYVKNVRTVRLDCFKIYKINTAPKVYNAKGERIKDFKLELMAFGPDILNRLLAVSAAKNLDLNSIIEVKYYVCFTSMDMGAQTVDVMAPENELFNGGILLMGYVVRHKTSYEVTV